MVHIVTIRFYKLLNTKNGLHLQSCLSFSLQDTDNFCLHSLVFYNSGCDSETSSTWPWRQAWIVLNTTVARYEELLKKYLSQIGILSLWITPASRRLFGKVRQVSSPSCYNVTNGTEHEGLAQCFRNFLGGGLLLFSKNNHRSPLPCPRTFRVSVWYAS